MDIKILKSYIERCYRLHQTSTFKGLKDYKSDYEMLDRIGYFKK